MLTRLTFRFANLVKTITPQPSILKIGPKKLKWMKIASLPLLGGASYYAYTIYKKKK